MGEKMTFKLTRAAKSKGGDRYECGKKSEPEFMAIYVPQHFSRKGREVKKELTITISD